VALVLFFVVVFDSVVHRWKDENNLQMVKVGRTIPVGSNIRATSRSAFENGLPVHTPTIELIFDFILKHYGKKKLSLIMTESPMIPPYCKQEIMELMFEGYNCFDKVAFVLDGPATLPPSIKTALVIHIGATNTHIYPIIQDAIDWAQSKRINWGGVLAAEFLLKIMGLKYPGILNSTNPNKLTLISAQAIWQKTALVAPSISAYESQQDALACPTGAALETLNCCIRLTGDAASEADRRKAVAESKKAAAINQAALQEKRKILADKLRQKSEEQREAKIRSKEHIYKALQRLVERVQVALKKTTKKKKTKSLAVVAAEDEDISMEFSDNDEVEEEEEETAAAENVNISDVIFNSQNLDDVKLFEELKRLGFASLSSLQEGLRRAEEDFFRLSGQTAAVTSTTQNLDFSLLSVADSDLTEAEIKEKRRLRLIKSSADARERQKAEKAAEDSKKQAAAEALEWKRNTDLEGWRAEIYGKRKEIIDRLIRKQKQRADRKGAAQGSRLRSVVALGDGGEESPSGAAQAVTSVPDSGPDDGFGLNDDDWLVYRQVSRDDEEDSDIHDQETLSQIETLLEEKDHAEFMKRLQEEQYGSLTLLDRLTFGGDPEAEIEASAGQPSIHINSERMRCTEALFQPLSFQGIDQAGLIEILINLFSVYSKEIQAELVRNVYVSGGPACLPGLRERLTNEISAILSEDLVPFLNLKFSNDLEASWKGIRERSSAANGSGFNWITRDKYFESKPEEQALLIVEEPKNKKKSRKTAETPAIATITVPIIIDLNDKSCSNPF
jgi:actin-related protein 5